MTDAIRTTKENFIKVIQHSQRMPEVNVDALFEKWYQAKKFYIDAWKGQTIVELPFPVTFNLDNREKERRLSEFISAVENTYNNVHLAEFIYDNRNDFFNNHLEKDYYHRRLGITIPAKTKIVRAFKFFENDERALADLQTQASMIIQEDKITGTLCFSVDPLDFLSLSENTYHWRSCHALDGEYRAGNLSYMMDHSTIICYLRGERDTQLPRFPEDVLWNSKKWRMLLFFSEDKCGLMAGRQYPFFSTAALEYIQTAVVDDFHLCPYIGLWSPWYNDYLEDFPRSAPTAAYSDTYFYGKCLNFKGKPYLLADIVHDAPHSLHFNDLLHSSCYTPYYCWYRGSHGDATPAFNLGGEVPCLCCGKTPIEHNDLMFCEDCAREHGQGEDDYFRFCPACDRRFLIEDGIYVGGVGEIICPDCAAEFASGCESCGDIWLTTYLTYDPTTHQYICPTCSRFRARLRE